MDIEEYETHVDEYAGWCSRCQDVVADSGVEPDARAYKCPRCGERTMMGIEEALLVGEIVLAEEE